MDAEAKALTRAAASAVRALVRAGKAEEAWKVLDALRGALAELGKAPR